LIQYSENLLFSVEHYETYKYTVWKIWSSMLCAPQQTSFEWSNKEEWNVRVRSTYRESRGS